MKHLNIVLAMAASAFVLPAIAASGAHAQSFRICEGEYQEPGKGKCPQTDAYAYCGTSEREAVRICRASGSNGKPLMVQMRTARGNKCGYAYWTVTCQ